MPDSVINKGIVLNFMAEEPVGDIIKRIAVGYADYNSTKRWMDQELADYIHQIVDMNIIFDLEKKQRGELLGRYSEKN